MMYKPSELAVEIGVTTDTIVRSYVPAGLPYTREKNHMWIYGPAFVHWAKNTNAQRKAHQHTLAVDEAWCMKCNQAVAMQHLSRRPAKRHVDLLQGTCPHCGHAVYRMCSAQGGAQ